MKTEDMEAAKKDYDTICDNVRREILLSFNLG